MKNYVIDSAKGSSILSKWNTFIDYIADSIWSYEIITDVYDKDGKCLGTLDDCEVLEQGFTYTAKQSFRKFASGATRDTANGKLEYSNYINPLNDYSFAQYMKSKQIIGGEYRRGDNRQSGIPYSSLFESMCRHIEILKLLYKGHSVIEVNNDGVVDLLIDSVCEGDHKNIISELNSIRFNSEAMKLQLLKGEIISD